MALTNFTEKKLLDHYHGVASWTVPATIYFALHVGAALPNKDTATDFAEPTDANYARVSKANSSLTWNAATAGAPTQNTNAVEVDFGTAAADYASPIRAVGIFDAATLGNCLEILPLSSPQTPNTGNPIKIPIGQLTVQLGKTGDTFVE